MIENGERCAARRARVLESLGERGAMIIGAGPELHFGRDLEFRYRPTADLYWLTGCPEPDAVAVLCPSWEAPFTLFVRPRDPDAELWSGVRGGPEAARERYGAEAAYPLTEIDERLTKMVRNADALYFRLGAGREALETLVRRIVVNGWKARQRTGRGPNAIIDPGAILDEMRLVKDDAEIALLREACRITAEGISEIAPLIRPGVGEWEVEAALEAAFRRRGAIGFGFQTIVASGANATVLHYVDNTQRIGERELLLIDAGASYAHYNADVTRTFPVGGAFTQAQRALYEAVESARWDAVALVKPGATIEDVHAAAVRRLVEGLVGAGILEGDVAEIVQDEARVKRFYPHRTAHWLGLDVHDVGDYAVDGRPRVLQPGMVFTVEPGLYIPSEARDVPEAFRGIGLRIEDDVLVTAQGHEVLTAALPTGADEVAALVRG